MKTELYALGVALTLALPAEGRATGTDTLSAFDAGLEAWVADQTPADVSWQPMGGNPGGHVRFDDSGFGSAQWILAPAAFLGDWSAADGVGSIQYDQVVLEDSGCGYVAQEVRITGALGDLAVWTGPLPSTQWTTTVAPLTQAEWAVTGDWSQLLSDVVDLRIRVEVVDNTGPCPNAEVTGTDNVRFQPCAGAAVAAQEVSRAGLPPNPVALLPGQTSAPVVGATWDPRIDHSTFLPGAVIDVLVLSPAAANVPSALGTTLCDLSTPPPVFFGAPGAAFAVDIPSSCSLVGSTFCAQGASADPVTTALTNALDLTIGSS